MTRIPLALLAVLALAGCSSGTTDETPATTAPAAVAEAPSSPSTAEPTETAAPAPAADPADELAVAAEQIGCTGWAQSADAAPYVDRWGDCDLDGSRVQLYLITSDANYAAFMDLNSTWGVTEAAVIRVGDVVACPNDQTQIPAVRVALGG